jgi:predicted dehydrogenase
MTTRHTISRRAFLRRASTATTASVVAFPFVSVRNVLGANSKLNIASVGVGGKGAVDTAGVDSENLVGLCDVDAKRLAIAAKKYPQAKTFADWRVMFDQLGKQFDAVTVSTPDHSHFHPSYRAVKERKHVYCQKPLTHTVWEARTLAEAARKAGVATQMGNQGISHPKLRRDAELVKAGVLGNIREMHCWTDRPGKWWKQGLQRPTEFPPVPEHINWDLWIGPAPFRPYHPAWGQFSWRAWWDFGTGAPGDMGCHLLNLAALAMDFRDPIAVEAKGEGMNNETGPLWSEVKWDFPARGQQPPFKFFWYDGGRVPPADLFPGKKFGENGVLVVGDKDTMMTNYEGGGFFKGGATYDDFKSIPETLPKHPNWDRCHYEEWIAACKGGPKAYSNFDVAGPVTEVVLLGNVALRAGRRIEWDAKKLKVTNDKAANRFLKTEYRKGWQV